jgi:hypothetical protein
MQTLLTAATRLHPYVSVYPSDIVDSPMVIVGCGAHCPPVHGSRRWLQARALLAFGLLLCMRVGGTSRAGWRCTHTWHELVAHLPSCPVSSAPLQVLNLAVPILYKKLVDSLTQQSTNSKGVSKEKVCGRWAHRGEAPHRLVPCTFCTFLASSRGVDASKVVKTTEVRSAADHLLPAAAC